MRNVYFTSLLMLCMSVHVKAGDWMKRLPDNLFVSQVSIPGTHDAATGNGVTLASYSQCQDIDVATQWSIGIRAFDFRQLDPTKNWFDVTISHEALKQGFQNYLFTTLPVWHRPHGSRPWKQLKYKNPLKYYWLKYTKGLDKI